MRATRTAPATQITFHGLKPSDDLKREIGDRVAWLGEFCPTLMACRVRLRVPHRHRRHGRHLHVTLVIRIPGRAPFVITHEPSRPHARAAIREAFDAARRSLEDAYGERRSMTASAPRD